MEGAWNRKWVWLDTVIFIIRTLWFLFGMVYFINYPEYFFSKEHPQSEEYGLIFVWLLLSYAIPQLFFRPGNIHYLYFSILELVLNGGLFIYLSTSEIALRLYLVPLLMIGYFAHKQTDRWIVPLAIAVLPGISGFIYGWSWEILISMIDILLFYGLGRGFNHILHANFKMQKLVDEIERKNKLLSQYASQIEKLTLTEERNRMARDLHDTVGHTFTSIIIGMDATLYLMDSAPLEAKNNLRELLAVTRKGLDDVRRNIHQIAPDDDHKLLSQACEAVIKEFKEHTGTKVHFTKAGREIPVSELVKFTLIRCLQESLTNAKRHGKADKITIQLTYDETSIELKAADDGKGAENIKQGFGLNAMKSRLENIQGQLWILSLPGKGTTVICTVPIKEAAYGKNSSMHR